MSKMFTCDQCINQYATLRELAEHRMVMHPKPLTKLGGVA